MADLLSTLRISKVRNFVQTQSGKIIEIARGEEDVRRILESQGQINLHTLNANQTAGNHYHHKKEELTYLAHGELIVALENPITKERIMTKVLEGHSFFFPAEIAHAIKNISREPAFFMYTSTSAFNPDDKTPDLIKYKVLE